MCKILDLLADKAVLIDEDDYNELIEHKDNFLEKTFLYTTGGKALREIINELSQINIGIIGTNQITNCLLDSLLKGDLLSNFHVFVTDRESAVRQHDKRVLSYSVHLGHSDAQKIVEVSDFVVVASNYHNHYLFNRINESCLNIGKKWLRVVIDGFYAEIGPLFIPSETCCYTCLHTRKRQNLTVEEYVFDDMYKEQKYYDGFQDKTDGKAVKISSLYPLNPLAAGIACSEIMKHFTGMRCNLLNQVLMLDGLDYRTQLDYVFKDYTCSHCVQKDVVYIHE